MALTAGTKLGPYEVLSPIGAGGMGDVYRARDPRLGRDVAIKVLPERASKDPQALERFGRESKAIAALSHPNILAIFDVGNDQDTSYAVTELLEGETLHTRLTCGSIGWRRALEIGAALADGLAAAHLKGIIHRDLKPENTFLTSDGRVKILDFGLVHIKPPASLHDDAVSTVTDVERGMVMGTAGYMSPEQVRGDAVDTQSDIFSLGCLLYEMVSGQRAFRGQSIAETLVAILHQDPPALAKSGKGVRVEIERLIFHCLEKNPAKRFQSARDIAFRLREILSNSETARTLPLSDYAKRLDSLAVLPFANASGDPDAEYFSDGITETIINNLSQLRELRVTARTTVFRYKGRDVDPQMIGGELNVSAVLTGKVVQRNETLQIQAELVDTADGSQLWGQRYHRQAADIFAIELEIAREISDTLRVRLTADEQNRLGKRYTTNKEAYQAYLKGRHYWNRRTLKHAVECFAQAVEKDPDYALAWAGMAECYTMFALYEIDSPRESVPKAKKMALKALEIDNSLAEPHACLGLVRSYYDWDWAGAETEFLKAIELNPHFTSAYSWYAIALLLSGRTDEAIARARHALEIEPLSLAVNAILAAMLSCRQRYEEQIEVIEVCRKAIELDPGFPMIHRALAVAYVLNKMYAEALVECQEAARLSGRSPVVLGWLGFVYGISEQRDEASKVLHELKEMSKARHVDPFDVALIYLGIKNVEQSLEWIETSCEDRSFWLAYYIRIAPLFESIRSEPRFQRILTQMNVAP